MVVELVSGPVSLDPSKGVAVEYVETGQQMFEAINKRFDTCDVLIMTAAIMDYRPRHIAAQKVKKDQLSMTIEMEPVIDILAAMSKRRDHQFIVGFAAETNNLEPYALKKLRDKGADIIVANRIGTKETGFQSEYNEIILFDKNGGRVPMGPETKGVLARRIISRILEEISLGESS